MTSALHRPLPTDDEGQPPASSRPLAGVRTAGGRAAAPGAGRAPTVVGPAPRHPAPRGDAGPGDSEHGDGGRGDGGRGDGERGDGDRGVEDQWDARVGEGDLGDGELADRVLGHGEGWDGEQWDREDRHALGRVAGTAADELADVNEVEYRRLRLERVILVGVWTSGGADAAQASMDELAALADTAGSVVLDTLVQRRERPDPATYIGSGRVADLRAAVSATGADTVICDGELTAAQLRTLEDRVGVKVVDRTALILDIFAQHASSAEGRAQVELAQLQYLIQRLRGWGGSLSRTGGGIGTRGPGETKLETDRRRITTRIARLRRELAAMSDRRDVTRHRRARNEVPAVVIVGYTNAGKSSLLNRLTGAGVLVENALFATLDPTVRRVRTPAGRTVTIADTVGFVRHLPTQLVESFRSTLEEIGLSDLVLHVVDASAADPRAQLSAVRQELAAVRGDDAPALPELVVLTKADVADPLTLSELRHTEPAAIVVSAHTGRGIDALLAAVDDRLPGLPVTADVLLPWGRGDLLERVRHDGELLGLEYTGAGSRVRARVGAELGAALQPFAVAAG